jgi:hypothetical protein
MLKIWCVYPFGYFQVIILNTYPKTRKSTNWLVWGFVVVQKLLLLKSSDDQRVYMVCSCARKTWRVSCSDVTGTRRQLPGVDRDAWT